MHDNLANTLSLKFDPSSRETFRYNAFVQDEIAFIPERWTVTVGSKFEINSYTDFEYQPSIRSLYVLDPKRVVWGAVSRAVRTPSRLEEDIDFVTPNFPDPSGNTFIEFRGNKNLKSEDLLAYELGYRAQPTERFAWDIAWYFHRYDKLVGFISETPYTMGGTYTIYPLRFANGGSANVHGFEISTRYTLADWWMISSFYTFQDATLYQDQFSKPYYADTEFIRNQARLDNYWTLSEQWSLGAGFRYVDTIRGKNIPSYIEMDLRLGWQPIEGLEFEVAGENLLNPSHLEYSPDFEFGEPDTRIRRAVFAGMAYRR
jgi:iron complex outermembrane receptor protein